MSVVMGNLSLGLSVMVALGAIIAAMAAARFESKGALTVARVLVIVFAGLITLASAALLMALASGDFSILYVSHYTDKALPLGYKLTAFWAGQAGSIMLWAWLLAAMAVVFVIATRKQFGKEAAATLAVLAIVLAFMAVLLTFGGESNPFRVDLPLDASGTPVVPQDGRGLNPLLQDPGMIAHPPLLFLGYAGYTIPFAMMMGALIAGRRDDAWIANTRRWTIASWLFLSIGILLGAQWAYTELGWGGYWAWDPVENASLLPWLTGTALMHSIMAQQQRGMLRRWNAFLFAATFALCIFGTYLTRSGIIDSVHGFGASMVGTFFFAFLMLTLVASFGVIVWRRKLLRSEHEIEALTGREGAFLATNVLLVGMTLITLIGTIFPVISRTLAGDAAKQVTVKASFYNSVVAPLGLLLVALMAVGPLLVYGKSGAEKLAKALPIPAALAAIATAAGFALGLHSGWGLVATFIAVLTLANVIGDLAKVVLSGVRGGEDVVPGILKVLDGNHRRYGGQVTHVGVMMIIVGIVGSSVFGTKNELQLKLNEPQKLADGRTITATRLDEKQGPNYSAVEATVNIAEASGRVRTFGPQVRFYKAMEMGGEEQRNAQVSLDSNWREDLYLTLAGWDPRPGREMVAINFMVNPLVSWIWTGGAVMSLGGIICLLPRLSGREKAAVAEVEVKATRRVPANLSVQS